MEITLYSVQQQKPDDTTLGRESLSQLRDIDKSGSTLTLRRKDLVVYTQYKVMRETTARLWPSGKRNRPSCLISAQIRAQYDSICIQHERYIKCKYLTKYG